MDDKDNELEQALITLLLTGYQTIIARQEKKIGRLIVISGGLAFILFAVLMFLIVR